MQAILSSPDKRLTLNQVYDWLISNVSYFSDRQDTATSGGWKNSIRHNLSLHQKFLKIPNEDAGKSSWWTLNPDNKQVVKKRRSTYGDCREKMKKRANEVAKNRGRLMKTTSSSLLPISPYPATDSFRNRSNSSASSCDETMSSLSSRLSADESLVSSSSSPFRQRSYSSTSSTSHSSGLVRNYTDDLNYDFDNIKLDDLSLGSDFIREYLSTQAEEEMICEESGQKKETKSVTILEPRNDEMVCQSVLNNLMYSTSLSNEFLEKMDERRRLMIENELTQLVSKRDQCTERVTVDNQLESGYEFKIKLLEEELQRLDKHKTVKPTPIFNTAFAI